MSELVSVIVPIYNMGDSIEICVESILKQDYSNLEIILVDDGSKDDSYEKCLKLARNDNRIKVFHTENRGSGPARNYGIKCAKGNYLYFPDADDFLVPHAISTMMNAACNGKYDLIVFGYKEIKSDNSIKRVKQFKEYCKSGSELRYDYSKCMTAEGELAIQGAPWNKLFKMEVVKKYGLEYPPLRRHQDEGFIARYVSVVNNVHFIGDVLYIHYVNDLKKVWDKFPVNYIETVNGLHENRKETILTWNPNDYLTHELVDREYICSFIQALELSFAPKAGHSVRERKKWIVETIKQSDIETVDISELIGKYQKFVMKLIHKRFYRCLYFVLKLKVRLQERNIIDIIKKKHN